MNVKKLVLQNINKLEDFYQIVYDSEFYLERYLYLGMRYYNDN